MSRKTGRRCVVLGCSNSSGKLQVWNKTECEEHGPLLHEDCPCLRPYGLHKFPGRPADRDLRQKWIENINRKDFIPGPNNMVCGIHFVDGRPTKEHPYPTLHLRYELNGIVFSGRAPPKGKRPEPLGAASCPGSAAFAIKNHFSGMKETEPLQECDAGDHDNCSNKLMKDSATQTDPAPSVSAYDLDEKDSTFFTGLGVNSFWQLLHTLVAFLPHPRMMNLGVHDQLLLVLMRLRLGLMFRDLGKRFGISRSIACEIFSVWRSVLAKFMREKLIAWLPRDTLKRIRPQSFSEHYPQATCIINCTEIFVRRPKNLKKQSQTYSNYKHNTYKFLYCIAPNGYVMFVSKLFEGRASDAFLTMNSGFVDHLLPGDQILAERGFSISDVLPSGVTLALPAFTRGCTDLSEHAVPQPRHLENARVHVEHAINRLKVFKILSNVMHCSVKHVEDIVSICAGLCNLQPWIIQDDAEDDFVSEFDNEDMSEQDGEDYL